MTDQEVKKLKRQELLELLYYMRKELDEVRIENERLRKLIDERSKDHEEIMTALSKAKKQIDRLCRAQLGESAGGRSGAEEQDAKPQSRRKKRRRSQNSGK